MRNLIALAVFTLTATVHAQPRVLDAFDRADAWQVVTADGVELQLSEDRGALRMDYDFRGGGYAIARRAFGLSLPANFRFTWRVRAEGPGGGPAPVNDLEFKLVDPSGDNVWWHNRRRFAYPQAWTTLTSRARHVQFAWGPLGGGPPRQIAHVEFVVTAVEGGRGTVWLDDFTYEPLPTDALYTATPRVTTSAGRAPSATSDVVGAWTAPAGRQALTLDFGGRREIGGLTLAWEPGREATAFRVETSDDGLRYEPRFAVTGAGSGPVYVPMPETEARYVRLSLTRGPGRTYALRRLTVEPLAFAASRTDLAYRLAADAPRGHFPRALTDTAMVYWTVAGLPNHREEVLVSEEASVEVGRRFLLEPFLYNGGKLLSWNGARHDAALVDGDLPIPTVTRTHTADSLSLTTTAWVEPAGAEGARLLVRYRVASTARRVQRSSLLVALRPFQVNPPWQFLNEPGGAGRITRIAVSDAAPGALDVDSTWTVAPLGEAATAGVGVTALSAGRLTDFLVRDAVPPGRRADDPTGLASGAWRLPLALAPGAAQGVTFSVPLDRAAANGLLRRPDLDAERARWRGLVGRVQLSVPDSELVQTMRANLAYVLVNADGPSLQPGSRAYERSWIRDGSLTSAALLRLGLTDEVKRFLEWYAPYQFESGRVPCCVDRRGADPTPEHDSHGQLIYGIAEVVRITGDTAFARRLWPHVARSVAAMDSLRATHEGPEYRQDTLRAYYSLLPASISHEGYSARPMHSYWDYAFALKGYKDAAYLARTLGRPDSPVYLAKADTFRAVLARSFRLAMAKEGIDYLPGSVELGDFDATSTTVFIAPGSETRLLPEAMQRTFDRYWQNFVTRRDGGDWDGYTPYEWRTAGTMLRLGAPARAWAIFDWFFGHRRPPGFRHWAEVVFNDAASPRFIGDMPHTWVGTDFLRSALDLFGFEDEASGTLVVGAGLRPEWLAEGVSIRDLHTWYGPLTFSARRTAPGQVEVRFTPGATPPGGLVLRIPGAWRRATADGQPVAVWPGGEVRLPATPSVVVLSEQ